MDKPWLLTPVEIDVLPKTFFISGDVLEDETICRAQHLKTLEWLETVMGTYPIDEPSRIYTPLRHWREFLAQARKDVGDG